MVEDEEDEIKLVLHEEPPVFKTTEFAYTKRKMEEDEDVQKQELSKNSLPARLQQFLSENQYDDYIEILNVVTSSLMWLCFAVGTYFDPTNPLYEYETPVVIKYTEIILMMFIIVDYLLFWFISENRIFYIFSQQSFLTYLANIPTALIRFGVVKDVRVIDTYLLNLWKIFQTLSNYRLLEVFARRNMNAKRALVRLIITAALFFLLAASIILTIENHYTYGEILAQQLIDSTLSDEEYLASTNIGKFYSIHDILYYIMVTFTTVGYGDICPASVIARYATIICMVCFLASV